jgi:hypothetical protein
MQVFTPILTFWNLEELPLRPICQAISPELSADGWELLPP